MHNLTARLRNPRAGFHPVLLSQSFSSGCVVAFVVLIIVDAAAIPTHALRQRCGILKPKLSERRWSSWCHSQVTCTEATLLNCPRPLYNVVQSTLASPFAGSNSIISSEVTLELATSFAKESPLVPSLTQDFPRVHLIAQGPMGTLDMKLRLRAQSKNCQDILEHKLSYVFDVGRHAISLQKGWTAKGLEEQAPICRNDAH